MHWHVFVAIVFISGCIVNLLEEEVRCGNLSVPPNGVLLYNDDRVGDSAEYRCDNSFQLLGDGTRSCLPDGMWSGEKPTCFVSCPPLPDPANGLVMHNGTELGSEACYSCDAGFFLIDCSPTSSSSMTTGCISCRICNDNGTWSGVVPKCSGMFTPMLVGGLTLDVRMYDVRTGHSMHIATSINLKFQLCLDHIMFGECQASHCPSRGSDPECHGRLLQSLNSLLNGCSIATNINLPIYN